MIKLTRLLLNGNPASLDFSKSDEFKSLIQGQRVAQSTTISVDGLEYYVIYTEPTKAGFVTEDTELVCLSNENLDQLGSNADEGNVEFGTGQGGLISIAKLNSVSKLSQPMDVFCSWETLTTMGIFDGDYISMARKQFKVNGQDHGQLGFLYVDTVEYLNILSCLERISDKIEWKPSTIAFDEIQVANAVKLTRIQTVGLTTIVHKEASRYLLEYFKRDSSHRVGDLIQLKIPKKLVELKKRLALDEATWNMVSLEGSYIEIWYKIKDATLPTPQSCFRISISETKVMEEGSLVPGAAFPNGKANIKFDEDSQWLKAELLDLFTASLHPDHKLFVSILISGSSGSGKEDFIKSCASQLEIECLSINLYTLIHDTIDKTGAEFINICQRAKSSTPCILLLNNLEAFSESWSGDKNDSVSFFRDGLEILRSNSSFPVILIATTTDSDEIDEKLKRQFAYFYKTEVPAEQERILLLKSLLQNYESPLLDLKRLAKETAGFSPSDLETCTKFAQLESINRLRSLSLKVDEVKDAGTQIIQSDFDKALNKTRKNVSEQIGAPKIPNVQWEDIGGLEHVKDTILETIELPLKNPELFAKGVKKRSGVLLYGPPGTGKTLVAKAVATTLKLNFFSVKGPELLDMYIGESEANVRKVFEKAKECRPCVVFFDELDSVAPKRGDKSDAGGVMDRIVSQLLAELDNIGEEVFCIGATNRPDLLDPALLRPGRFDKLLFLGVSENVPTRVLLLKALTRKFKLENDFDFVKIAEMCPPNLTGADFYALCSDAMLKTISRMIEQVDRNLEEFNKEEHPGHPYPTSSIYYLDHIASDSEKDVIVTVNDFVAALKELEPSVSQQELQRYLNIRDQFEPKPIQTTVARSAKAEGKRKL